MKLDRRIPSDLFIISFVFLSEYYCIYYSGFAVTYLLFIKLNAIFKPWNTNRMLLLLFFEYISCCLFFISEEGASASLISRFLFSEINEPKRLL